MKKKNGDVNEVKIYHEEEEKARRVQGLGTESSHRDSVATVLYTPTIYRACTVATAVRIQFACAHKFRVSSQPARERIADTWMRIFFFFGFIYIILYLPTTRKRITILLYSRYVNNVFSAGRNEQNKNETTVLKWLRNNIHKPPLVMYVQLSLFYTRDETDRL